MIVAGYVRLQCEVHTATLSEGSFPGLLKFPCISVRARIETRTATGACACKAHELVVLLYLQQLWAELDDSHSDSDSDPPPPDVNSSPGLLSMSFMTAYYMLAGKLREALAV